jgi:hypothetical protein
LVFLCAWVTRFTRDDRRILECGKNWIKPNFFSFLYGKKFPLFATCPTGTRDYHKLLGTIRDFSAFPALPDTQPWDFDQQGYFFCEN